MLNSKWTGCNESRKSKIRNSSPAPNPPKAISRGILSSINNKVPSKTSPKGPPEQARNTDPTQFSNMMGYRVSKKKNAKCLVSHETIVTSSILNIGIVSGFQHPDLTPKSTGLFSPGTALGGGGFPPPSVKLDLDILES